MTTTQLAKHLGMMLGHVVSWVEHGASLTIMRPVL